jgi:adenylate kinase
MIKERYGICHLSTGDMLRDAVAAKTANGLKAKAAMDAGQLVTDDIVFGILQDGMKKPECAKGYIIDGLPRTLGQAQRMKDSGIHVDRVLHFEVPDDVIVERTSGRWIHRSSGRTYHEKFFPPKTAGIDDVTGEPLMQRPDDRKEVVTKRLHVYHHEVNPILNFYRQMGILDIIDGNRRKDDVTASVLKILDPLYRKLGGKM